MASENSEPNGVWVAYYPDWSGMYAFNDELLAMRCGVANGMSVKHIPFGVDFREETRV